MGARPEDPYLVWFDEYRDEDRDRVGGKNASLGAMIRAGLPVPPGFALTTDAYDTLRRDEAMRRKVHECLAEIQLSDAVGLREISADVRALIEDVPLDPGVERAVRRGYDALCEWCETDDIPVAVRSSATAEDLPDASFAGLQDTFLWVRGVEDLLTHVKRCWSSIFTDRAVAYRHEMGHDHDHLAMSVGVQKMVEPKTAGVAFTLNPADGDRSQVAIDASWGFGEAVVSGEVTPDNFLVDKVLLQVTSRSISPKTLEYVLNGDGTVGPRSIEGARRDTPCLTDEEARAVAAAAKRAERVYGCPQDVEWAIDVHLPAPDNVVLLQSRPETYWSRKPRRSVARAGSNPLEGIVSTLLSPVHTRAKAATVEEVADTTS